MKFTSLTLLILTLLATDAFAQRGRVNYGALQARAKQPNIYLDTIVTPGKDTTESVFTVIFRFDNDFLPFKKISPIDNIQAPDGQEYFATVRLNAEVFSGKFDRNLENLESVRRDFWSDTVFTKTFEDTQSKKKYVAGQLSTTLKNGTYNYLLQLGLGKSVNDRNSSRQNLRIQSIEQKKRSEVYIVKSIGESANPVLTLTNMGQSVEFGKDFHVLFRIPNYDENENYTLKMNRVNPGRKDTTVIAETYSKTITAEEVYTGSSVELIPGAGDPKLQLNTSGGNQAYALVTIPNSTFENSVYRFSVSKEGTDEVFARRIIRSFWSDMPASLFSLDISLDLMRYIVSEEQLKELKKGDRKQKEQNFRKFWKDKDPTPKTVFNELMAEYYRRVDYAYDNFSAPQTLGYESDQGEVYIKFGPPDSVDRRFPTNGDVIEVWKYGKRSYIFEKTSGFGEFELVSRS